MFLYKLNTEILNLFCFLIGGRGLKMEQLLNVSANVLWNLSQFNYATPWNGRYQGFVITANSLPAPFSHHDLIYSIPFPSEINGPRLRNPRDPNLSFKNVLFTTENCGSAISLCVKVCAFETLHGTSGSSRLKSGYQ